MLQVGAAMSPNELRSARAAEAAARWPLAYVQVRGTISIAGVVARLHSSTTRPLAELSISSIEGQLRFRPASAGFGYQAMLTGIPSN